MRKSKSLKAGRITADVIIYVILGIMCVIWLYPLLYIVLSGFRTEVGFVTPYYFPKQFGFENYAKLWTDFSRHQFPLWFGNTLWVSVGSCILTTFLTLSTAYVMSKLRFKGRKLYMNLALILGMFPGFMSLIAVYYILKAFSLTQNLFALMIVYSAGAGLSFYIAKGFFDTIPYTLNESAKLDGANNAQVFFKIVLPLSKPIIVYTALMAFTAPWADFILAKMLMGQDSSKWTVAIGLYNMMYSKDPNPSDFTTFAAGCTCVAIPITALFMWLQKYYVAGVTGGAVKG